MYGAASLKSFTDLMPDVPPKIDVGDNDTVEQAKRQHFQYSRTMDINNNIQLKYGHKLDQRYNNNLKNKSDIPSYINDSKSNMRNVATAKRFYRINSLQQYGDLSNHNTKGTEDHKHSVLQQSSAENMPKDSGLQKQIYNQGQRMNSNNISSCTSSLNNTAAVNTKALDNNRTSANSNVMHNAISLSTEVNTAPGIQNLQQTPAVTFSKKYARTTQSMQNQKVK